ncbi:hypothetical protein PGH12_08575 [Chryseobacterium wangxinyae]|uniref:hypothetical protein n=1 Tax=Chryseobacterium sp. CY350 TaxID=2997336 RepID=UPI00226E3E93|nr:hypothetical protein [Chryseobacterium sp. CY350]MCY0979085.1 hypothetical protein [Chryseobacterium sp. CY350]WBZ97188.1 hypothetical protein PGH12_08575 [Chryseobacterium sp. CY350]
MKKLIFIVWGIHIIISIVLFCVYRFVIASKESTETNFFEAFLNILETLVDLGFSILYFFGMVAFSLPFFLNFIKQIRNNYFLSLLTFLGLPTAFLIYFMIDVSFDYHSKNVLTTFVTFSIIYLLITITEFLVFRKKIQNCH